MAYLQTETMREVTESEIRSLYPNTSFTTPFKAPEGFEWVFPTPTPTVTELEVAVRDGVEKDSKGNLVEKWLVKDMFADTTNEDGTVTTKAEHEAAYLLAKFKATVPQSVTLRQAKLALLSAGLLDDLDTLMASNRAWQIEWEYATEVQRSNPLIAATGLSDEQIDQLFLAASNL